MLRYCLPFFEHVSLLSWFYSAPLQVVPYLNYFRVTHNFFLTLLNLNIFNPTIRRASTILLRFIFRQNHIYSTDWSILYEAFYFLQE